MPGENSRRLAARNRERVRLYFAQNPGSSQVACARALGLSGNAVNKHVRILAQAAGVDPRDYPGAELTDRNEDGSSETSSNPS